MEPHLVEGSLVAPFFQHWLSRVIFKLFASRHDESRQIFLVWCSLVFSGNVRDISGLCQNFRIYILLMWHLSSIQIPCTNELSSFFLPESDGKTQTNTQTISSPNHIYPFNNQNFPAAPPQLPLPSPWHQNSVTHLVWSFGEITGQKLPSAKDSWKHKKMQRWTIAKSALPKTFTVLQPWLQVDNLHAIQRMVHALNLQSQVAVSTQQANN